MKEVTADEKTEKFYQEIYNEEDKLVKIHLKYPSDSGHQKVIDEGKKMITRHKVAEKLDAYLHHSLPLEEVVTWAEQAMMEETFDTADFEVLRDIISRLGLADVREFGLSWEDCETYLLRLGYQVHLQVLDARQH